MQDFVKQVLILMNTELDRIEEKYPSIVNDAGLGKD